MAFLFEDNVNMDNYLDFYNISPFAVANDLLFGDLFDEEVNRINRRPRLILERIPYSDILDDGDFAKRFRLSKASAENVLQIIKPKLMFKTDRNNAVSPMNQLLLALRFYATGCTQLAAADFIGVSEPTACRIVHRVSAALAELYPDHIYMPRDAEELKRTQKRFLSIARFPKVIGAVDGTHVKIRSQGGEHAECFRNRKGFFSFNVQAVCNADLQFEDVVARWPGGNHDQTIFDFSRVRASLEAGRYGDSVLVGDSAYASRSYMMTPLSHPSSRAEQLYNESQIRTRNPIERIFGVYKRRFPAIAIGLNVNVCNVQAIIYATAVLHNILRRDGDPQPSDDGTLALPQPWNELLTTLSTVYTSPSDRVPAREPTRSLLINHYFGRM